MTQLNHSRRVTRHAPLFAFAAALSMVALSGCDTLSALLGFNLNSVRVELVNNGDYDVNVILYTGTEQEAPEDVLKTLGDREEILIKPGETAVFSKRCEDLQAIVIDEAELMVIGEIGPKTDTGVLRDGEDFSCGNAIIFTFDHTDQILDFNVTTQVIDR